MQLLLAGLIPCLAACAAGAPAIEGGIPLERAAGLAPERRPPAIVVLGPEVQGPESRHHRPVIREARIMAVWVPEHVDPEMDVKVSGHWVYFRLAEAEWHVQGLTTNDDEPKPPVTDTQPRRTAAPGLRDGFNRFGWIVPYRMEDRPESPVRTEESHDAYRAPR